MKRTYIEKLRKQNKMSLREVSEAISISHVFLRRVELGIENLSRANMQKLADFYKIPFEEIELCCGYLPDSAHDATQKNPKNMHKAIKRATKAIENE